MWDCGGGFGVVCGCRERGRGDERGGRGEGGKRREGRGGREEEGGKRREGRGGREEEGGKEKGRRERREGRGGREEEGRRGEGEREHSLEESMERGAGVPDERADCIFKLSFRKSSETISKYFEK